MAVPNRRDIESLLAKEGHCVSILLPTQRAGKETQKARIRLKNLVREAENRLSENGNDRQTVTTTLAPAAAMLEDEGFWRHLEDGLAVYLAPDFSLHFTVPTRIEETLVTGSRFYVLPLVPLLQDGRSFLILALSQKNVRLFRANRFQSEELELPQAMPRSLTEALGEDWKPRSLQYHSGDSTGTGAMFHGQGRSQGESEKEEASRFCQRVDAGLREKLSNGEYPMVVAAVDYLGAIFRQASHYPNLVEETLPGNPDRATGDELREKAWPLLEPRFRTDLEQELARCRELLGTGKASTDSREIVPAAWDGRVETLFVAEGTHRWGTFDSETRQLEVDDDGPSPQSEELLNLAASCCLRSGGTIHLIHRDELPGEGSLAAIFRY